MQCQCTVAHTVCLVCVVSLPLLGHVESTVLSFTGCHGNAVHSTVELRHITTAHTSIAGILIYTYAQQIKHTYMR